MENQRINIDRTENEWFKVTRRGKKRSDMRNFKRDEGTETEDGTEEQSTNVRQFRSGYRGNHRGGYRGSRRGGSRREGDREEGYQHRQNNNDPRNVLKRVANGSLHWNAAYKIINSQQRARDMHRKLPDTPYYRITQNGALALYGFSPRPLVLYRDKWQQLLTFLTSSEHNLTEYLSSNETRLTDSSFQYFTRRTHTTEEATTEEATTEEATTEEATTEEATTEEATDE